MKPLLFLIFLLPLNSFGQIVKYRTYKKGESFTYRLITKVYRNDKFVSKTISISKHTVVKNGNLLSEEINWLHKISFTAKDTVILDSIAQKIQPYKISLSPEGKVSLPKLTVPEMTGDITDLNTFYIAISPLNKNERHSSCQYYLESDPLSL